MEDDKAPEQAGAVGGTLETPAELSTDKALENLEDLTELTKEYASFTAAGKEVAAGAAFTKIDNLLKRRKWNSADAIQRGLGLHGPPSQMVKDLARFTKMKKEDRVALAPKLYQEVKEQFATSQKSAHALTTAPDKDLSKELLVGDTKQDTEAASMKPADIPPLQLQTAAKAEQTDEVGDLDATLKDGSARGNSWSADDIRMLDNRLKLVDDWISRFQTRTPIDYLRAKRGKMVEHFNMLVKKHGGEKNIFGGPEKADADDEEDRKTEQQELNAAHQAMIARYKQALRLSDKARALLDEGPNVAPDGSPMAPKLTPPPKPRRPRPKPTDRYVEFLKANPKIPVRFETRGKVNVDRSGKKAVVLGRLDRFGSASAAEWGKKWPSVLAGKSDPGAYLDEDASYRNIFRAIQNIQPFRRGGLKKLGLKERPGANLIVDQTIDVYEPSSALYTKPESINDSAKKSRWFTSKTRGRGLNGPLVRHYQRLRASNGGPGLGELLVYRKPKPGAGQKPPDVAMKPFVKFKPSELAYLQDLLDEEIGFGSETYGDKGTHIKWKNRKKEMQRYVQLFGDERQKKQASRANVHELHTMCHNIARYYGVLLRHLDGVTGGLKPEQTRALRGLSKYQSLKGRPVRQTIKLEPEDDSPARPIVTGPAKTFMEAHLSSRDVNSAALQTTDDHVVLHKTIASRTKGKPASKPPPLEEDDDGMPGVTHTPPRKKRPAMSGGASRKSEEKAEEPPPPRKPNTSVSRRRGRVPLSQKAINFVRDEYKGVDEKIAVMHEIKARIDHYLSKKSSVQNVNRRVDQALKLVKPSDPRVDPRKRRARLQRQVAWQTMLRRPDMIRDGALRSLDAYRRRYIKEDFPYTFSGMAAASAPAAPADAPADAPVPAVPAKERQRSLTAQVSAAGLTEHTSYTHLIQGDLAPVGRVHLVSLGPDVGDQREQHFLSQMDADANMGAQNLRMASRRGPFKHSSGRSRIMDRSAHVSYRRRGNAIEITVQRGVTETEMQTLLGKLASHRMASSRSEVFYISGSSKKIGSLDRVDLQKLRDKIYKDLIKKRSIGIAIHDVYSKGLLHKGFSHGMDFKNMNKMLVK